ncbi:hypothetical protein [Curtobacterium sp. PhB115]|uniref:hypothetical protein n=1 Tax=Curtobacterium sp. PhB115 TaxID=2485173 RepID=UPI000F4CE328|nr:hypothetical protein [Curtobacterium sp. PhB115]ROP74423.1 hypothetical protein EDF19_0507 [Curtobacterium sp. PhB115]
MWFERDQRGVHSVGMGAPGLKQRFAPETLAALESVSPAELERLHDAMAELEADVLVEYDPEDDAIDYTEEDRFRGIPLPRDAAFPIVTEDLADGLTAHVQGLPPRWRLDGAAVAFEMVGTLLDPYRKRERARRTATWRATARRRRSGSRSSRRR